MNQSPPRGMGPTFARVQRNGITWLAILLPPTLAYLAASLYFARDIQGASRLLGLAPDSAEAVLMDLLAAIAPLAVLIALYLRHLARKRREQRHAFLSTRAGQVLVYLPAAPALIYRRQGESLRIVWNADGPVADGASYPLPDTSLRQLEPDRFIAQGTP